MDGPMEYRDNNKDLLLIVKKGFHNNVYFNNIAINNTFNVMFYNLTKLDTDYLDIIFCKIKLVYIYISGESQKLNQYIRKNKEKYGYKIFIHEPIDFKDYFIPYCDAISAWSPIKYKLENTLPEKDIYQKYSDEVLNKLFWIYQGIKIPDNMSLNLVNERKERYIISIGRMNRDYETLFKSIENLDIKLIILSSKQKEIKCDLNNVEITCLPGMCERERFINPYLSLIKHSLFVVIPLKFDKGHKNNVGHGITTAIEACYLRKPLIATEFCGVDEYTEKKLLVKNRDPEDLKNKITYLMNDKNRLKYEQKLEKYDKDYMTWQGFCNGIKNHLNNHN